MRNLFFFILLFIMSCQQQRRNEHYDSLLYIDLNNELKIDDLFDDYHYVVLETNDENLINDISKVKILDNLIYIADERTKAIFVFDFSGKFQYKISKLGRGPGEYLYLSDFAIYNDYVLVLSRADKKILSFDRDTVKEIYYLDDYYSNFVVLNDSTFLLYSCSSNDKKENFICYNFLNDTYGKSFDPFEKNENYIFSGSPFNVTVNNKLFISKNYDYNLYEFNNEYLNLIYTLQFNTKEQLSYETSQNLSEIIEKYRYKEVVRIVDYIEVIDSVMFLNYYLFIESRGLINHMTKINLNSNENKTCKLNLEFHEDFCFANNPKGFHNGYLISNHPAVIVKEIAKNFNLKVFDSVEINDMDNPILFFYKLKI